MTETSRKYRRFEGVVVSAGKMAKTIVVQVDRSKVHAKYGKRFTVSKNFKVHDELGEAKMGDKVVFEECRPLSRDKRSILVSIIKK